MHTSPVAAALDAVTIGPAIVADNLTMIPLLLKEPTGSRLPPRAPRLAYVLLDEALASGAVEITEVSDQGSVPELRLLNRGKQPVLIVDGEEPLFGLEFSTAIWNVGFVKRPGHICLLVTLDKAGHGEDFQYKDHFSSPAEFEWESQNRTGQSSADGQQPVVKRQRRTEAGEAPRGQGATTENTGSI